MHHVAGGRPERQPAATAGRLYRRHRQPGVWSGNRAVFLAPRGGGDITPLAYCTASPPVLSRRRRLQSAANICGSSSAVCGLRAAVCGLRFAICGLRAAVCGSSSPVCRLQSMVCRLQSMVCRLQSVVCGLSSAVCLLTARRSDASAHASPHCVGHSEESALPGLPRCLAAHRPPPA